MKLNYKQLMEVNLKGYKYFIGEHRMTMTSRSAYETTTYIVLEDDGEVCVVTEAADRKWHKKYSKSEIARLIAQNPCMMWDEEKKANVNLVEQL